MKVELLHHTPLQYIMTGIRTCWASQDKSDNMGDKDLQLIERIANKNKHSSVLRHSLYIFRITASTKTLLAFTRHKAGVDFSVQSSRYTTTKLAKTMSFTSTSNSKTGKALDKIISIVKEIIQQGASDDDIAMLLPQAYEYTFQVSMNAQAIQHFLELRTSPHAHYDIRSVAFELYKQLPESHKYLFKDSLYK